jgi:hypothetical protein
VQNRLPDGASWDGKSDLPVDEKSFQEMLSDRDPGENTASARKSGT